MYPLGLGSIILHFDWLWISVVVSICYKGHFLDEGSGLHLSVDGTNVYSSLLGIMIFLRADGSFKMGQEAGLGSGL